MILLRVIEHVKGQKWTAIVIAFVIVVMGVFVGLQVNNWNEARADRSLRAIFRTSRKTFSPISIFTRSYAAPL